MVIEIEEILTKEKEYDELLIWMVKNGYKNLIKHYKHPKIDINTISNGIIYMDIYYHEIPLDVRNQIEKLFGKGYNIKLRKEFGKDCREYIQLSWKI